MQEPDKEPMENQTQKTRFADHPHWWTIILSVVAIVVSGLSFWESYRSRVLNEAVNRPLVRVTGITSTGPVLGNFKSEGLRQENSFSLNIHNSGKAFANDVKVNLKAQVDDSRTGKGFLQFSDFADSTTNSETIGDLAPEDDYQLTTWASILKDNPTVAFGDHAVNMVSLYIKGNVSYTNPINGARYTEAFCFLDAGTYGSFHRCSSKEPLEK
jgi:hypothetical protein